MTTPIDRVTVSFSRWCQKKELFEETAYILYGCWTKKKKSYYLTREYKTCERSIRRAIFLPAPTKENMRKWLAPKYGIAISGIGFNLWEIGAQEYEPAQKTICELKAKTEWLALQEAVKIVKEKAK